MPTFSALHLRSWRLRAGHLLASDATRRSSAPAAASVRRPPPGCAARTRPAARPWRLAFAASAAAPTGQPSGSEPAGEASAVQELIAAGKLNKTALNRLAVMDLRAECTRVGLPADGLKAALVERLLVWATQQAAQQRAAVAAEQTQQLAASQAAAGRRAPAPAGPQSVPRRQLRDGAAGGAPAAGAGPPPDVSLTFLGTSSGNPTSSRNVSSIAVRFGEDLFLVDVGEGSRNQLRRTGLDLASIRRLFITHLHGDHCFGVCGLLSEICQARLGTPAQSDPIVVYGPPELHALIPSCAKLTGMALTTPVAVMGWVLDPARAHQPRLVEGMPLLAVGLVGPDQGQQLSEARPGLAEEWQAEYDSGSDKVVQEGLTWTVAAPGGVRVVAAQLQHRIPCWGYVFEEPAQRVPAPAGRGAGSNSNSSSNGNGRSGSAEQSVVAGGAEQHSGEEPWVRRGRKLVVLGDTCDSRAIARAAHGCDIISHEATYMRGMEEKAAIATHSTSEQAGAFARQVNARSLVLTHFSARYGMYRQERGADRRQAQRKGRDSGRSSRRDWDSEGEEDLDEGELQSIVQEAEAPFGSERVFLASDYFSFRVYPRAPEPLDAVRTEDRLLQLLQSHDMQRLLDVGQLREVAGLLHQTGLLTESTDPALPAPEPTPAGVAAWQAALRGRGPLERLQPADVCGMLVQLGRLAGADEQIKGAIDPKLVEALLHQAATLASQSWQSGFGARHAAQALYGAGLLGARPGPQLLDALLTPAGGLRGWRRQPQQARTGQREPQRQHTPGRRPGGMQPGRGQRQAQQWSPRSGGAGGPPQHAGQGRPGDAQRQPAGAAARGAGGARPRPSGR